jgi:hypothetical protein
MTIKEDIQSMFWEPAIDYANAVEPITFETDAELPAQQEKWDKVHKAYSKGVTDVLEYIFNNYNVFGDADQKKELNKEYCQCDSPDRDSGYTYCQRCNKNVSDARMRFLVGKDEMFKMPASEPDPDEVMRLKLRDDYEYHDMCARATIHPGKTIDDVKVIHMQKRIEDAYKFINDLLLNTNPMNTPETRKYVVELIQKRINHEVIVRCNEENNPPDIIDENLLIAELFWNVPYDIAAPQISRTVLVFGSEEQIGKYQKQYLLDNEMFKFIQKGL